MDIVLLIKTIASLSKTEDACIILLRQDLANIVNLLRVFLNTYDSKICQELFDEFNQVEGKRRFLIRNFECDSDEIIQYTREDMYQVNFKYLAAYMSEAHSILLNTYISVVEEKLIIK